MTISPDDARIAACAVVVLIFIAVAFLFAWLCELAERRFCYRQWQFWKAEADREYRKRVALCDEMNANAVGPEPRCPVDSHAAGRRGGPYAAPLHLIQSNTQRGPD